MLLGKKVCCWVTWYIADSFVDILLVTLMLDGNYTFFNIPCSQTDKLGCPGPRLSELRV